MKDNNLLEFKNLVTEFHTEGNTVKAVNDISFCLNKGETIGIFESLRLTDDFTLQVRLHRKVRYPITCQSYLTPRR